MRATKFFLFFGIVLLALAGANAFAAVDVTLEADGNMADQITFDLEIHMTGTDTVGAFTLYVDFDKDKIQITNISSDTEGMVVPNQDGITNANADGSFSIAYASISGFVPGTGSKAIAVVTCKPLAEDVSAVFELDNRSSILSNELPPQNITGSLTGKTVSISKAVLTLEEIRKHMADYNEAKNTNFKVSVAGDLNGNDKLDIGDIIMGLQILNGIR